jgi:DNA (cytosine-5)-methyltransferase 1
VNTVLSLFSGCGGFDAGFARSGFDILAAFDKSDVAVETYNSNLKPVSKVADLRKPLPEVGQPDVLIAGPPCQGFSTIGSQRLDDERNDLLSVATAAVLQYRPSIFVLENVPGLASSRHRQRLDAMVAALQFAGYFVECCVLKCEEHGLPQRRRRLFLVARSGGRPFKFALRNNDPVTVGQALAQIAEPQNHHAKELAAGTAPRLISERIKPGQKLSDVRSSNSTVHSWQIPEVYGPTSDIERQFLEAVLKLRRTSRQRSTGDGDPVSIDRITGLLGMAVPTVAQVLVDKGYLRDMGGSYEMKRTFNGSFRRLDYHFPSPTVDTHFGEPRLFLHPVEHRGMSPVEAAVLQGFSQSYRWPSSRQAKYRLIGNAVPPIISSKIAEMVRGIL